MQLEPRTITALEEKGQEGINLYRYYLDLFKINATGFLSASAKFELRPDALVWLAAEYAFDVDNGLPPSTFVPVQDLAIWIEAKGLRLDPLKVQEGILERGTRTWQSGGMFLLAEIFDQEYIDEITAIIKDDIQQQILTQIKRGFKIPT